MRDKDYVNLAKALGKAKEHLQRTERRTVGQGRTAFDVVMEYLLMEFLADNPRFEADRFMQIVDGAVSVSKSGDVL